MHIGTGGKIALGAVAVAFAYALFAPKARFVGDRLQAGDRASVSLSGVPELAALVPPEAIRAVVLVLDATPKDSFTGQIVAAETTGGEIPIPGGIAGASQSFPKVAVAHATHAGKVISV